MIRKTVLLLLCLCWIPMVLTQAAVAPPTFVFFASDAASVHFSYRRYLENRLREAFGFNGTPLRIVIRERAREDAESRQRRRAPARSK